MSTALEYFLLEMQEQDRNVRYETMEALLDDRIPDHRRMAGWAVEKVSREDGEWVVTYHTPNETMCREQVTDPITFLGSVTGGADPHTHAIYAPIGVTDGYAVDGNEDCPHPSERTEIVSPYTIQVTQIVGGGKNLLYVYCKDCNTLIEHVEPENSMLGTLSSLVF